MSEKSKTVETPIETLRRMNAEVHLPSGAKLAAEIKKTARDLMKQKN